MIHWEITKDRYEVPYRNVYYPLIELHTDINKRIDYLTEGTELEMSKEEFIESILNEIEEG
jgi:hypothetical protein